MANLEFLNFMSTKLVLIVTLTFIAGITTAPEVSAQAREASVNSCISFDHYSNSLTSFAINSCSYKVYITWTDDRYCSARSSCAATVGAYRKESIGKVWGALVYGACKAPALPKRTGAGFHCMRY